MASDENWLHTALILHCRSIRFCLLIFMKHGRSYFQICILQLKSNSLKILWNWPADSEEACVHRQHSYHQVTLNVTSQTLLPTAFVLFWKYTQYSLSINHIWTWDTEYSVYIQSIILGASLWTIKITEVKAHVAYKIHRTRYNRMKLNMYYNTYVYNNL